MRPAVPSNTLLIATFDEKERAERVVTAFNLDYPCDFDEYVSEKFLIKSLLESKIFSVN